LNYGDCFDGFLSYRQMVCGSRMFRLLGEIVGD